MLIWSNTDSVSGWGWLLCRREMQVSALILILMQRSSVGRTPTLVFSYCNLCIWQDQAGFQPHSSPRYGGGSHFLSRHHKVSLLVSSVFLTKHPLCGHGSLSFFPSAQKKKKKMRDGRSATWQMIRDDSYLTQNRCYPPGGGEQNIPRPTCLCPPSQCPPDQLHWPCFL